MMGSSDFYSVVSRIIDTNDVIALLEEIYKNSELSVVVSTSRSERRVHRMEVSMV